MGDYTREMARTFAAQGHEVWVLVSATLRDSYPEDRTRSWVVLPIIRNWRRSCWSQIRAALREVRPDVVSIQYQAAAYDMRSAAINFLPLRLRRLPDPPPFISTFHDLKPPYLFPKAGPLRGWVVRALARYSAAVIVTNAEDFATASSWSFVRGSDRPTLHQIPIGSNINVAPPADYERGRWRARLGYGPRDFVWAYFGFLNQSKGGETLVRALAQVRVSEPSCRLLMIGGRVGSSDSTNRTYASYVEGLIDALNVSEHVQWTGYVPAAEVSAALLSADVLVLPYGDGVSFRRGSLHAALAHGCAVVSTAPRVPVQELRNEENILLVPPEDPDALSRAVLRLYRDLELRQRIGKGARAMSRQFTWERIAQRTVEEVFEPLAVAR